MHVLTAEGVPVWSKLATGQLPNWNELMHNLQLAGLEQHGNY
jgi:hypothetical protein